MNMHDDQAESWADWAYSKLFLLTVPASKTDMVELHLNENILYV